MRNREYGSKTPAMVRAFGLAMAVSFGLAWSATAEDWPMWGGSKDRNMYAPEAENLPAKFDPGKIKQGTTEIDMETTENVNWVAKLGSKGYATPVVANGRVLIGTNNGDPRDPRFEGDYSILMCFDETSGEFLWQLVVPKLGAGKVNDWERLGLLSSPYVEGDRAYLVTTRNEVMCLDLNGFKDGNDGPFKDEGQYYVGEGNPPVTPKKDDADIVWVYDMMYELGVFPHNSSNSSPLVVGDKVYAGTSNGVDYTHKNVPSPFAPSLICLDKETGELLGEDNAQIGKRVFHGQWSSPTYAEADGKDLILYGGGDGFLYAFGSEPEYNEQAGLSFLPTVWKADAVPHEYRFDENGDPIEYPNYDGPSEINATPVVYEGKAYAAIGQDPAHSEGLGNLICVDISGEGDITDSGMIWDYQEINRSISTVGIANDLVYVGDFSGFVHCLDADTGEQYWVHDMKAHMWGSPIVADGKVYIGDEDGDFVTFKAGKEKQILSKTTVRGREADGPNLGAPVYASPIVANGVLYVATTTHLYAISKSTKPVNAGDQVPEVKVEE